MDSKTKRGSGEVHAHAELSVGDTVLKKSRQLAIVQLSESGNLPRHPFYLTMDAKCTIPVAPYTTVGATIGIQAPLDVAELTIEDGYAELRAILVNQLNGLIDELTGAIVAGETDAG